MAIQARDRLPQDVSGQTTDILWFSSNAAAERGADLVLETLVAQHESTAGDDANLIHETRIKLIAAPAGARREQQMDMVGHEDERMDGHLVFRSEQPQVLQEEAVVIVGEEAGGAVITTLDDVIGNLG